MQRLKSARGIAEGYFRNFPGLFYPGQGFWEERPVALFFHVEIAQGFSHIGRIDRFLQLAVSHPEYLLADPVEGTWVSPGGLGNQENSPWSEDF